MERSIDINSPIDITLSLDENTIVYPGDPPMEIKRTMDLSKGDSLNISEVARLGLHLGTHIDFPSHFLANAPGIDHYSIKSFVGNAVVIEVLHIQVIQPENLTEFDIPRNTHIILKTDNSNLLACPEFDKNYTYLSEQAAKLLVSLDPISIGIDYYSLDSAASTDFQAHKVFAKAGIPAFVCLDLRKVKPGNYHFIGLPLSFSQVEASPVRAILYPLLS